MYIIHQLPFTNHVYTYYYKAYSCWSS